VVRDPRQRNERRMMLFGRPGPTQHALLLRPARGPHPCRGYDARRIVYLVEFLRASESGLAVSDGLGQYEITPAGRRFIAMTKDR
jgi:hypothetical protein